MADIKTRKRLLDVYFELCLGNKFSIEGIESEYGVARRTAQRIIADIDACIGGLESEILMKRKYWFLPEKHKKLLVFTEDDFLNLHKIKEALPNNAKDEIKSLETFIAKVNNSERKPMADNDIYTLLKCEGKAVSQYPQEKIDSEILKTIRECILAMKKLRVTYRKKNETMNRVICPYGLIKSTKKYLIATEEKDPANYKYYAISKIKSATNTDEYFDMNEDFDLKEFMNKSFSVWQGEVMDVCLKFSDDAVEDALNYNFHPTQKVEQQDDGSVLVKFQASGEKAICWEIFKWEPFIEIIAPERLKNSYANMLGNSKNCK